MLSTKKKRRTISHYFTDLLSLSIVTVTSTQRMRPCVLCPSQQELEGVENKPQRRGFGPNGKAIITHQIAS
jgi:hypothetical protein